VLKGGSLFAPPTSEQDLLTLSKDFVNKSWQLGEATTAEQEEQILSDLDCPGLWKQLPAVARTAIECVYREEFANVLVSLPHRPEFRAVNRVCRAYAELLNRLIDTLPEATQDRIHHTLMRERHALYLDDKEYFGLDGVLNTPDGWELLNGHPDRRNPSQSIRHFFQPLPFDDTQNETEVYQEVVRTAAKQSLTSIFWDTDPIDWSNQGLITVNVRNPSGTPHCDQFFAGPVTWTHLLQSAVEKSDHCHFETWLPLPPLIEAVKQLQSMFNKKARRTNFGPDLRNKFDQLTQSNTLKQICDAEQCSELRYDNQLGCLIVHPERPNRYLAVTTPDDIASLPCVAQTISDLKDSFDQASAMALIRLLRAVDGNYTAEDILDFFKQFSWFQAKEASLKTLLSRRHMHNIVGCDHPSDPIINNCIGKAECPYRMAGSLPLSQSAKVAFHRGQRENQP
jgi:hypothetical protein